MKTFKGKAIYNPSGKAGEYSYWACNFYVGCSNGCTYCYCKKSILAHAMGGNTPKLKACFKDESHALDVFNKELKANLPELQKHGLFFTFTSDPFLFECWNLTWDAIHLAINKDVPVKVLTKRAEWVNAFLQNNPSGKSKIAFGFTLTGHDELEPNASTNAERIEAMRKLHDAGFKTWASIEPVIDMNSACDMIRATEKFCDLYKIGLMSGKLPKHYKPDYLKYFIYHWLREDFQAAYIQQKYRKNKFYFKDSLLKQSDINRKDLPNNCVGRDYNIFNR